jgi:hypothetical protein
MIQTKETLTGRVDVDYARLRAVFGRGKTFSHGLGQNGSVRARTALPFYPQNRTSSACPGMSVWCQFRQQPIETNEYHSVDGTEGFLWISSLQNDLVPFDQRDALIAHDHRPILDRLPSRIGS